MIPLKDDAPRVGTPYITYFLIGVNTFMFMIELWVGNGNSRQIDLFLQQFGVVPARFPVVLFNQGYVPWDLVYQLGTRYIPTAAAFVPVFTSMFLHGSWAHLIFNMLSLWIFGDNVEDYLGHFRYIVLYLVSGVAATVVHTLFNLYSTVPTVGASGAIAGVMGAYFLLYPRSRVLNHRALLFSFGSCGCRHGSCWATSSWVSSCSVPPARLRFAEAMPAESPCGRMSVVFWPACCWSSSSPPEPGDITTVDFRCRNTNKRGNIASLVMNFANS